MRICVSTLGEILADTCTPKDASEQPMKFAWDTTVLNDDGQDRTRDMNGVWRKSDFQGELD